MMIQWTEIRFQGVQDLANDLKARGFFGNFIPLSEGVFEVFIFDKSDSLKWKFYFDNHSGRLIRSPFYSRMPKGGPFYEIH